VASHNTYDLEVSQLADVEVDHTEFLSESEDDTTAEIIANALADEGLSEQEREEVVRNGTAIDDNGVPDGIKCYWDLVQKKLALQATMANKKREAEEVFDEFTTVSSRMSTSASKIAKLQTNKDKQETELKNAKEKYKMLHEDALKLFYTAKGDLNNYNNERKKVDLDAAQAKSALGTYLKYKKSFIEASADADDPTASEEVQHYKKLSTQYLDQYHEIEGKIKQSYSAAKKHQKLYFDLSKEYHKMTEDANDVAKKVEQIEDTHEKTKSALKSLTVEHQKDVKALPDITTKKTSTNTTAVATKGKFDEIAQKTSKSKTTYLALNFLFGRLTQMSDEATSKSEREQLRFLDFTNRAQDKGAQLEGTIKSSMLLKSKFQAANKTAAIYMKSYQWSNCDRVQDEAEQGSKSPDTEDVLSQCKQDKKIADANLEASKKAKLEHMKELTHLAMVRKEHEQAASGAKTAASLRDTAKEKAKRLRTAAGAIKDKSVSPCQPN
jgi:hypothetical protein